MAGTKPVCSDRSSTGWSIPCGSPAACFPAEVKWHTSARTMQTQALTETIAGNEMFCLRDLLEGSVPAKVMNRAYEYVIKQDLLSVLRETPLTHQQRSVLAPQRRPLDFLYRLWLKTEYSHIDALRRAVRRETRRIYLKRQTEAFRKEHPMG